MGAGTLGPKASPPTKRTYNAAKSGQFIERLGLASSLGALLNRLNHANGDDAHGDGSARSKPVEHKQQGPVRSKPDEAGKPRRVAVHSKPVGEHSKLAHRHIPRC